MSNLCSKIMDHTYCHGDEVSPRQAIINGCTAEGSELLREELAI